MYICIYIYINKKKCRKTKPTSQKHCNNEICARRKVSGAWLADHLVVCLQQGATLLDAFVFVFQWTSPNVRKKKIHPPVGQTLLLHRHRAIPAWFGGYKVEVQGCCKWQLRAESFSELGFGQLLVYSCAHRSGSQWRSLDSRGATSAG